MGDFQVSPALRFYLCMNLTVFLLLTNPFLQLSLNFHLSEVRSLVCFVLASFQL